MLMMKLCAFSFIPYHLMPMNPIKFMLETVETVDLIYFVAKFVMAKLVIASFFIPLKVRSLDTMLAYVCLLLTYLILTLANNFCWDVMNVLLCELCILIFSIPMVFSTLCMAVSGPVLGTLVFLGQRSILFWIAIVVTSIGYIIRSCMKKNGGIKFCSKRKP